MGTGPCENSYITFHITIQELDRTYKTFSSSFGDLITLFIVWYSVLTLAVNPHLHPLPLTSAPFPIVV